MYSDSVSIFSMILVVFKEYCSLLKVSVSHVVAANFLYIILNDFVFLSSALDTSADIMHLAQSPSSFGVPSESHLDTVNELIVGEK